MRIYRQTSSRGVGVRQPLGHNPLEVEPLGGREDISPTAANSENPRQRPAGLAYQTFYDMFPLRQWVPPQILAVVPEHIEDGVMQVATTGHQIPEILPALLVKRHDFPVQDHVSTVQLVPNPVAEPAMTGGIRSASKHQNYSHSNSHPATNWEKRHLRQAEIALSVAPPGLEPGLS